MDDQAMTEQATNEAEPKTATPDLEKPPAWFGPALIRAYKNDFLEHIKVCAKCKTAKEVDEVCPEGLDYVKALKMDQRSKADIPTTIVKKSDRARHKAKMHALKKATSLRERIDDLVRQIEQFIKERESKTLDIKAKIDALEKEYDEAFTQSRRIYERIKEKRELIEKLHRQVQEATEQIEDMNKRRDSLIQQGETAHIDRDQTQSRLDEIYSLHEPKIQQLTKEKKKLEDRLSHHLVLHPEIEDVEDLENAK